MAANSWNIEVDMPSGHTLKPLTFGEFGEGEEGRIDVADGEKKYKVRDQILSVDEVMMTILIKRDKIDYRECQDASVQEAANWFVRFVDPQKVTQLTFLFKNVELVKGKKNAFDRNSKAVDTKSYILLPEDIEEIQ